MELRSGTEMKINNKYLKSLLISAALVSSLTACSDWFQGKIEMDMEKEAGSLATLLTPVKKVTSLDAPEQVFATEAEFYNTINVWWHEVSGATHYSIQRAVILPEPDGTYILPDTLSKWEDLDWKTIKEKVYSCTYEDKLLNQSLSSDEKYTYRYLYRVMAGNISKKLESEYSCPWDAEGNYNNDLYALGYLFAPVSSVEATKGKSSDYIKLTWKRAENATSYDIYRDTREDFSSSVKINTTIIRGNVTSYKMAVTNDEDKGKEFYFKVIAQNSQGNYSAYSSMAMGYALQSGAPSAPSNFMVVNGLGTSISEIKISWEALSSTDEQDIKYSIYRSSSQDSVYTCIAKELEDSANTYTDTTAKKLKTGVYYYYYIQSIGYPKKNGERTGDVLKSAFSDTGIESETPAIGFLVSPPSTFEVQDSDTDTSKVKLVWTPALGTKLKELNSNLSNISFTYNVYYADSEDGAYNLLLSNISGSVFEENYLCLDEVEKKNFYKITSVNTNGVESVMSKAAAPQPDAPKNVNATKTKNLSAKYPSEWAPNLNEVYPVEITWENPDSEPVPSGFDIYRSTKPNSAFRKINDELVTDFSYIDVNESAKAGIFYYYKVVSINSLGQGKKGNNPDDDNPKNGGNRGSWGYGALTRDQWFREYNKEIASSQAKLTLMHKSSNTDKLGSETINAYLPVNGKLGTLYYNASIQGLGGYVTMPYTEYADHGIFSDGNILGLMYILNGNTDTKSDISANGNMLKTVHCYHYADYTIPAGTTLNDGVNKKTYTYDYDLKLFQGMYPGSVVYDNLQIKGGAAGGGYYLVTTYELDRKSESTGTVILNQAKVDWLVGEEIRN